MSLIDRIKRKVISRLTDEVDVLYFDEKKRIDNKVAQLVYKDRVIIIDIINSRYIIFKGTSDKYHFDRLDMTGYDSLDDTITEAKNILKNDEVW